MGIDIYFSDESLQNCKYSLCAEPRKTHVEVVYNDTSEDIEWWQFRRIRRTEYRHSDIVFPPERSLFAYEYRLQKVGEEFPQDLPSEMPQGLKLLIRQQNKREILEKEFLRWVEKKEFEKLVQWCHRQPNQNKRWLETAWYGHLDWKQQRDLCHQCPVAPLDEESCYLRFSNYPSMDYFKVGMIALIAYAEKCKDKTFEEDPFAFPHLDRKKKETPRDKLVELWKYCGGTRPKKVSEQFFNKVYELFNKATGDQKGNDALSLSGHPISTEYIPFVDEFLGKCIYRDDLYTRSDAEKLIPILETLDELAEYAKHEERRHEVTYVLGAFQWRIGQLLKALRMAKKFGIECGMSY